MNNLQLTINNFAPEKKQITISIGPIEEQTVTYDELAQMICDVTNYHLSDDPKANWLGKAIDTHTNLFDKYEFALSIIKTSTTTTFHIETGMTWSRKPTSSI